jgi:tRNA (cytosine38-C5)-methyltransferase
VSPENRRTSCFTAAYGKYIKGTGSVLLQQRNRSTVTNDHGDNTNENAIPVFQLVPPDERQFDPDWTSALTASGYYLRYFSGTELARLFGFCETFCFPESTTVKQQWKLIGNSLNVRVAARLVELGLCSVYKSNETMQSSAQ